MFRANYNYDSKYYAGASIRYDGLSSLPEDTRWGTFWGASVAWRLSRENFWKDSQVNEWFNDLRIRASYATLGNSDLGNNFPYLGTYGAKLYGSQSGVAWNRMGNNNLKWETTETFDLGLDSSFFNNRLTFELAYWQKNSKDLVLEVPTPPTMGIPYNSYYDNIGKIKNSGFELTVSGTVISTQDWNWRSELNFSTVKTQLSRYTVEQISLTIIRLSVKVSLIVHYTDTTITVSIWKTVTLFGEKQMAAWFSSTHSAHTIMLNMIRPILKMYPNRLLWVPATVKS